MKKEIFNKIFASSGVLQTDDMTVDEKKAFYAYCVSRGMTEGFAYDRFFREGFRQWEVIGIDSIKSEFMRDHQEDLLKGDPVDPQPDGTEKSCPDGDRGYASVLALRNDEPGGFYRSISHVRGLIGKLKSRMTELGMSETTTWLRFRTDNWKEFELAGIRSVVNDFIELQNNKG